MHRHTARSLLRETSHIHLKPCMRLRPGVCSGANDASCGAGAACAAKATCQHVSLCNSTTRTLTFASCYGFCRVRGPAAPAPRPNPITLP